MKYALIDQTEIVTIAGAAVMMATQYTANFAANSFKISRIDKLYHCKLFNIRQ